MRRHFILIILILVSGPYAIGNETNPGPPPAAAPTFYPAMSVSSPMPPPASLETGPAASMATHPIGTCELQGNTNSADAVLGAVAPLSGAVATALSADLENIYQKYGQICDVQKFAADSEKIAKRTAWTGLCLRYVKYKLYAHPWLLDGPPHSLDEGKAANSMTELESRGFFDVLPAHPELAADPSKAPIGAIVIYRHNGLDCPLPKLTFKQLRNKRRKIGFCEAVHDGHIEIHTPGGFSHQSFEPDPELKNKTFGPYLEVAAVLIKPVKLGDFDLKNQCYARMP